MNMKRTRLVYLEIIQFFTFMHAKRAKMSQFLKFYFNLVGVVLAMVPTNDLFLCFKSSRGLVAFLISLGVSTFFLNSTLELVLMTLVLLPWSNLGLPLMLALVFSLLVFLLSILFTASVSFFLFAFLF